MLCSRSDTFRTRCAGCVLRVVFRRRVWRLALGIFGGDKSTFFEHGDMPTGSGKGASLCCVRSINSTGSWPHSFCDTHRRYWGKRRTLLRTAAMQAEPCISLQVACRIRALACGGRGSCELLKHSTALDALAVSVNLRIAFRPACLVRGCLACEHACSKSWEVIVAVAVLLQPSPWVW